METYAGYSENADWNVGRVLDAIEEMGELDNTLVIWIWGDNGASMEGTLSGTFNEMTTLNGIPLTTEQQMGLLFKHGGLEAWGGELHGPALLVGVGVGEQLPLRLGQAGRLAPRRHAQPARRPLPEGDRRPGRPAQPLHARDRHRTDRARDRRASPRPTRVDGIEQEPLHGFTFADSLSDAERARAAHAAVLRGGRKPGDVQGRLVARDAAAAHPMAARPRGAAAASAPAGIPTPTRSSSTTCRTTSRRRENLADEHPEKVEELRKLFWEEAERYQVLPILGGLSSFYGIVPPIPKESKFTYRGRIENVAAGMIPRIYNHSYTISADLVVPEGGVEGVIVAAFDHLGGFALYVQDGKLKHHYSMLGVLEYTQAVGDAAPGRRGQRRDGLRRRRAEAGDGRGGDAARERRAGRDRADGAHRARRASRATRGWTSAATTAWSSTAATPTRRRSGSRARSSRSSSTSLPHMSEEDAQALHEHAQQALAAHAASA